MAVITIITIKIECFKIPNRLNKPDLFNMEKCRRLKIKCGYFVKNNKSPNILVDTGISDVSYLVSFE